MPSPSENAPGTAPSRGARFLRDHGLSLALLAAFAVSLTGMLLAGWLAHNDDLAQHGRSPLGFTAFAASGAFLSALFENWESEFLQMAAYVIFTAFLFQRGSAESRDPDDPQPPGDLPAHWRRRSRLVAWVYSYSLGIVLALLFVASFLLHWTASIADANQEALEHGVAARSALDYTSDPRFWFESFQNWQSEFLSTAVLVILSIFLRFRGSPESKPVSASNRETGT
jgi:MFS family permease